jgi:hypothetical protein
LKVSGRKFRPVPNFQIGGTRALEVESAMPDL